MGYIWGITRWSVLQKMRAFFSGKRTAEFAPGFFHASPFRMFHPSPTRHQEHRHFDDGQGHAWCECLSLEGVYRTDDGGEMIYRLRRVWFCVVIFGALWSDENQGVLQDSKSFLFKFVESLDLSPEIRKFWLFFFVFSDQNLGVFLGTMEMMVPDPCQEMAQAGMKHQLSWCNTGWTSRIYTKLKAPIICSWVEYIRIFVFFFQWH